MNNMEYTDPVADWYYNECYDDKATKSMKGCFYSLVGIILLIVASLLFSSCKTIQYVPVETIKTEYKVKTDTFIQKDSVIYHDSVYIHSKGDTVWYEKWHTKYKDRVVTKIVTDTIIKTDSIQVPYPVERKLTKWERVKMDAGGISIVVCFVVVFMLVIGFVLKSRKII